MSTEPENETMPAKEPGSGEAATAKPKKDAKKEIMSWILTIVTAVAAAFLIRTFLLNPSVWMGTA